MCNMMISAILDPTPTMSGLRSVSGVMHLQGGLWVQLGVFWSEDGNLVEDTGK